MSVSTVVRSLRTLAGDYLTSAGKQAASNLIALVVLTGLTQTAILGTILLLTKSLGPAGFGVFTFALALQPYLYLAGTLGTSSVLFREGTNEPGRLPEIITSYQAVGLTGSLVVGVVTVSCAWLAPIAPAELGLICLIAVGNVATCLALAPVFDLHHRQPLVAAIGLGVEAATLGAVFTLVQTGQLGLVSLGIVFAGKWWLITIAQYVVYQFAIHPLRLLFHGERLRRMLRSSLPLAGGTLIAGLPMNAGVFFVRLLSGEFDAGIFAIASQAVYGYLLFSYLGLRILQPHIAGPYGLDRSFLRKLFLFTAVFLTLLYLAGVVAGSGVVWFILAPPYRAALVPMFVLLAAALLFSVGHLAASYLVVLHRERTVLAAHFGGAVVYITASLVLVPTWSILGAATAALLAAVCGTAWMVVAVRNSWPVAPS